MLGCSRKKYSFLALFSHFCRFREFAYFTLCFIRFIINQSYFLKEASMKNLAGYILFFFAISILCIPIAQPDETAKTDTTLDEIVVTAKRAPLPYSELPDNITIITSKELSRMAVTDLAGALKFVNGIDLQKPGFFSYPSTISIQGCDPAEARIMVDGILLNSQGRSFGDPSQVPIANIDRIEIIKGSGSSAWGSALGGVINVVTKKPQGDKVIQGSFTPSGGWGNYGFYKNTASASGKMDKFAYSLWASALEVNNEQRPNSAIRDTKFSGKLFYTISSQTNLEASYNYSGADIGGYEFEGFGYGEDLFSTLRYGSLKLSSAPNDKLSFSVAAKFSNQDNKVEQFSLPDKIQLAKNASKDIFAGIDLQTAIMLSRSQTLSAGCDLGKDSLNADMMDGKENLRRAGYYANYLLTPSGAFSISAGGRYDTNTAYGNYFSPSGGIVYHAPFAQTNFRLSSARAFNAPPLIYKYIFGNPFLLPNPLLKAEKAPAVYEAGFDAKPVNNLWFKFAAYRSEVRDYLAYDPINLMMKNLGKIRRQGMESEIKYSPLQRLQLSGGWSLNRIEDLETSTIIQGSGAARVTYNAGADYRVMDKINLNLKGNYHFWNEPIANKPQDRKFIWDGKISYTATENINAFISVYNILDSNYWTNKLLPYPGREVELGVSYGF
jgi:vitamin B12 transporter